VPVSHSTDTVFIAGNFNGWNPGNADYQLFLKDSVRIVELKGLNAGLYEFKFTRGSWRKVESTLMGTGVVNHSVQLISDTSLSFTIPGWSDDFASATKTHTASSNVSILDTAFLIPQLNRQRRIWIYLPSGYKKNKKRYPVMYLQDGQNIFDEYTSAFGEWGVDECLDSLSAKGEKSCIVIGIDNGGATRMNEYNPYEFTLKDSTTTTTFLPEGDEYLSFVSNTLKPFIDSHFRTLSSRENTIIAGSSMGGLISYYALLKYPQVFGKAGIFSPSFWTANGINRLTDWVGKKLDAKIFFYMGDQEGKEDVDQMKLIAEKVGKNSNSIVYTVIDPCGKHNEQAWRKWFAEFYNFMIAAGFNLPANQKD
jgi:metallo-beta-lactamase class B